MGPGLRLGLSLRSGRWLQPRGRRRRSREQLRCRPGAVRWPSTLRRLSGRLQGPVPRPWPVRRRGSPAEPWRRLGAHRRQPAAQPRTERRCAGPIRCWQRSSGPSVGEGRLQRRCGRLRASGRWNQLSSPFLRVIAAAVSLVLPRRSPGSDRSLRRNGSAQRPACHSAQRSMAPLRQPTREWRRRVFLNAVQTLLRGGRTWAIA